MGQLVEAFKGVLKPVPDQTKAKTPVEVQDRIDRAAGRMRAGAPKRSMCLKFFRDDQFHYVNEKGVLSAQPTVTYVNGGGKPRHRVRNQVNIFQLLIKAKVSAASQRVPGYEINPSSFDPRRVSAASLAGKIAVAGYDKWRMRRMTKKWITLALVADEGFVWPFWDSSIGPFVPDPERPGKYIGTGDVNFRVLSRNEVGWEPGMDFEDSPYWIVQQARPIDQVKYDPEYLGGDLTPDATTDSQGSSKRSQGGKLVLVTDYLERPCARYPSGRWLTSANGRLIGGVEHGEDGQTFRPYPLSDDQGKALDEPVLHRLSYQVDPDADEDMGLGRYLIDPQRALNDAWSKSLEWKNRALNPQILAPVGSMKTRPDDEPGSVKYYTPVGGLKPEWENVPPVPDSLFKIMDQAVQFMQMIAAGQDPPQGVEAGKAIAAFIEQQQVQWQDFVGDLAEGHSRIMRHALYLVCKHYNEKRLMKVRGQIGWEPVSDFQGSDLLGEVDVRVLPGSVVSLTRQQIMDWLNFLVTAFPGAISAEQAMAALDQGTAENLIKDYQLDIARANRVIQKIKAGPDVLFQTPPRVEGGMSIPGWMPRRFDNIPVAKMVFEGWLKTDDFENCEPGVQEAANLYYEGLEFYESQKAMLAAQQQTQMAEQMGMANAANPQGAKPLPSLPGPGDAGGSQDGGPPQQAPANQAKPAG